MDQFAPAGAVHITPEKFENAASLLRSLQFGLLSTLIRHGKRSFSKTLLVKPEEYENAEFSF